MPDDPKPPESRPEPPPERNVYGGQWGGAGKQGVPDGEGKVDRPGRVKTPDESHGEGDHDGGSGLP